MDASQNTVIIIKRMEITKKNYTNLNENKQGILGVVSVMKISIKQLTQIRLYTKECTGNVINYLLSPRSVGIRSGTTGLIDPLNII